MVFYWLVGSVTQAADPNALPPEEKIIAGLLDTAEKHYARLLARIESSSGGPQKS
jgi:hypothetical protein